MAAIRALLAPAAGSTRLVTLVGPDGVGKTRLALAVAHELVGAYAEGVVFIDLVALRDHRLVPAAIARTLGLGESGDHSARDLLLEYLRVRPVLLVLDNFEHLLGAVPLVVDLLASCAALKLLVTSRSALRLRAEQRVAVAPLAVAEATQLV